MGFVKATKRQAKGRIALFGTSGSGKTYTSLIIARELANGGRVAVIDTESGSASKYADEFDFDTCDLPDFSPQSYIDAIAEAARNGYAVVVVDSLSHAWMGRGGVLEIVDKATARSRSNNTFSAGWKEGTPEHNRLIEALVGCRTHLVVTMRSKTEYVVEDNGNGKKMPRKVGLAPVQRDGMEYEFDIVGDMDAESNKLVVSKSRCKKLSGGVFVRPDAEFGQIIRDWLIDGTPPEPVTVASADQVAELRDLLETTPLPEGLIDRWLDKARVSQLEQLPADVMEKCLDYVRGRKAAPTANGTGRRLEAVGN